MNNLRDALNSPVLMNLLYWSFLAIIAIKVSPVILWILIILPGFVSDDRVIVTEGSTTVDIEAERGTLDESDIRSAVKEAKNGEN